LKERRGEVSVRLGGLLLAATLIFAIVLNIRHVYQVTDMVIDKTNAAVLAVASANAPLVYGGAREGEAVSRNYADPHWNRYVTTGEVSDALLVALGGVRSGSTIRKNGSFSLLRLQTQYVNSDGGALNFRTTFDLNISLMAGGPVPLSVTRQIEVKTTYEPKF